MEKVCRSCGQIKEISEFYKHPKMADGHLNKCKECQKANSREARSKNIERYREHDRNRSNLPHRIEARKQYQKSERGKEAHSRASRLWAKQHPNRRAAHHILSSALRDGKVIELPCFICGKKAHAHHPDYDRPLDVIWLCPLHHKEAHMLIKKGE